MNTNSNPADIQAKAPWNRSRWLTWTLRVLLGLVIGFFTLCALGAAYQTVGAQADKRNFPPPGRLYDVGGYLLHLYCTGPQDSGNPTVILDTLSGGTSADWGWIQPEIAQVTRVCSYDRPGQGWSETTSKPKTLRGTVGDLHALLQKAGVKAPYVLVGHSIGGTYARQYASDYPGEVIGMVLVDTAHPDWFVRHPEGTAQDKAMLQMTAYFPALARLGLFRFYFATGQEIDFAGLPPKEHGEVAAFWSSPTFFTNQRAENMAGPELWKEALSLGNLGKLPLAVITRGRQNQPEGWAETQDEMAALSSNRIHITVDGATHSSLAFNQKDAQETSRAILAVVEAARTNRPLASQ